MPVHLADGGLHGRGGRAVSADAEAAGAGCSEHLRTGDVVLVKGSRGVHLERAIEVLGRRQDVTGTDGH